METKTENPITTELAKQNVTEAVIAQLKKDFLPLKINGIDDKEGYKKVHDARIVCRDHRTLTEKICKKGREDAVKIQKDWIAKEKEVVAQISEVEQYLKKQEDTIDAEKEAIKIKAERLLKLPSRKEQMIGIEDILGPLTDEDIMRFDDAQWNQVIMIAQTGKLRRQQEAIDAENAKRLLEKTILRENELINAGATLYSDGTGKVYRKGSASISEQMVQECIDEGWPKIIEVFTNAVIPPKPESAPTFRAAPPISQPKVTEISDEEKLFNYANALERVPTPILKTDAGAKVFADALELLVEAIILLRK